MSWTPSFYQKRKATQRDTGTTQPGAAGLPPRLRRGEYNTFTKPGRLQKEIRWPEPDSTAQSDDGSPSGLKEKLPKRKPKESRWRRLFGRKRRR
ncbi:hypothetical protein CLCR_05290 [Cladophialophora carrionii]|uniref:Uncharacterized protein n=1 Tax=Cladophialophora carrionii TaxID=86049 RepID=A0A1C1CKI3_9EURO|nr:hypothetical protein CLCR_05290 [Cladophialophora carrionii]